VSRTVVVLLLVALACSSRPTDAQTAFQAATTGARCTQNAQGSRSCRYEIGSSLVISIAAVGESDAGVSFLKSDFNGDFYARMAVQHRCVIVSGGTKAPEATKALDGYLAFISPRTGLVYRTWESCEAARSER
jgi:hypothetical protein